jgi:hypothetical protein
MFYEINPRSLYDLLALLAILTHYTNLKKLVTDTSSFALRALMAREKSFIILAPDNTVE